MCVHVVRGSATESGYGWHRLAGASAAKVHVRVDCGRVMPACVRAAGVHEHSSGGGSAVSENAGHGCVDHVCGGCGCADRACASRGCEVRACAARACVVYGYETSACACAACGREPSACACVAYGRATSACGCAACGRAACANANVSAGCGRVENACACVCAEYVRAARGCEGYACACLQRGTDEQPVRAGSAGDARMGHGAATRGFEPSERYGL